MRRRVTTPPPLPPPSSELATWTFDLETITPVLGGGVEPFEPDDLDIVRVPGLRGHLRWWWRALFATPAELRDPTSLLAREARLWGGVFKDGGVRSPVRLRVDLLSHTRPEPAGKHEWREPRDDRPGRYRPLPTWNRDLERLSYALFPLMRDSTYLEAHTPDRPGASPPPIATKHVRRNIVFRLSVAHPGLDPKLCTELLATLWMWAHFGGVGARTRRGFGALGVRHARTPERGWSEAFDRTRPFVDRLRWVLSRVKSHVGDLGERLAGAKLFVDTAPTAAADAHGQLLRSLADFRQRPGFARDPGNKPNTPGRSRWPEPDLLRALYAKTVVARGARVPAWEHPPRAQAERFAAPRAAFGMPLELQFKQENRQDSRANAAFLPPDGRRWPSPLLLRPLASPGGKAVAAMLVLSGPHGLHLPPRVQVEFKDGTVPSDAPDIKLTMQGAAASIAEHGSNALQAFWRFVQKDRPWTPMHFSNLVR
jgi:CRISPR-associated protein Cmr1